MSTDSVYKVCVTGFPDHFHHIRRLVHFFTRQHGASDVDADIIERAVAEACHNALFHSDHPRGQTPSVEVEMSCRPATVRVEVRNRGPAFEFDDVKPFRPDQDFLAFREGGLGIPIMKALMDEVHYERREKDLNVVTLVKHINVKHRTGEVERDEDS